VAASVAASALHAQGIRERMRLAPRGTTVTRSQAEELTLTLTQVTTRPIQTWVRTAGSLDKTGKIVTAVLSGREAALVKVGQRARTFPVESRSSMYQARVVRVSPQGSRMRVDVEIVATGRTNTADYLVEIVTDHGDFLSVPNEAIIEEGTSQVVYVQRENGQYGPQPVRTGTQGELYTQILEGVKEGDQVVTFGSFFIDSEYKLKGTTQVGR
jgi:multidrug efflux pump subunit AcrA (membrane-fusion protein)